MEARVSNHQRWTLMPRELLEQIDAVFTEAFSSQATSGRFVSAGRIYPRELVIQVGFLRTLAITQNNFVVSVQYETPKDNIHDLIHLSVDVLAELFREHFELEQDAVDTMPWQKLDCEGRPVYWASHRINSELEDQADRLLKEAQCGTQATEDTD